MWNSKDVTLVIMIAVVAVVYSALIAQMAAIFTGIKSLNYLLFIGHAIWASVAFLLFEGRRWRFGLTATIIPILTLPTHLMGAPYDLIPRIPAILNAVFADIIVNSLYSSFTKREKLRTLSIFSALVFTLGDLFFRTITLSIYFPPEVFTRILGLFLLLLPVLVVEAVAGGIIGFQIFQKVKKLL